MNEAQASDPITGGFAKYDIVIEVKTLCRKNKTTTWAELVQNGFKIGDCSWGEDDLVIKTSGVGHARMGLLASYMTDRNRHMNPVIAKAILPELEGSANGLGHIVLAGYKEGSDKSEPLITVLFEFTQQPGGKIKVSKTAQDYFEREKELKGIEHTALKQTLELYAGLEQYKYETQGIPLVQFGTGSEVAEHLRGRRFSPCLTSTYKEIDGPKCLIINIREHTNEPEGISPPYLFSLSAEEGEGGSLWLSYGGSADPSEEEESTVREVFLALREVVFNKAEPVEILPY